MSQTKPGIKSNIDLTSLNTLGVSAIAAKFLEIEQKDQLSLYYESGFFENNRPVILGGGSNILFLNDPTRPVLKVSISGIKIIEKKSDSVKVEIGAGENWHDFVTWAVEHQFGGVENLALIPGTVGAAPIQNIGAYGVELEEVFDSLELFDLSDGAFKIFKKDQCAFGYRDSIFKQDLKGRVIVTRVILNLTTQNHNIENSYKSLQNYLIKKDIQNPTITDIYNAVSDIRRSKLPDPNMIGNAGSFFKNPVVINKRLKDLQDKFEEVPHYRQNDDEVKIPAGWLIEKAGWKGKRIGDVGTYQNQALVIVNHGKASGSEIYNFSRQIQKSILDQFGIELVPEVNIVK